MKDDKLIEDIDRTIELINYEAQCLMKNDMSAYNDSIQDFSLLLNEIFPKIIMSYSTPELKDYAEDATYWTEQLMRIVETLADTDRFKILDVLYYETRGNLINYRNLICA